MIQRGKIIEELFYDENRKTARFCFVFSFVHSGYTLDNQIANKIIKKKKIKIPEMIYEFVIDARGVCNRSTG